MVPRDHQQKKSSLHEKLQLLRSVTNSQAVSNASIIIDASKYIEELKEKVQRLNEDITVSSSSTRQDPHEPPHHKVTVETLEKGFAINVYSEKSTQGLLVSILEAFEDLGLTVLETRISCTGTFHLEAVGGESEVQADSIDAQMVKHAVMEAIKNCREDNEE